MNNKYKKDQPQAKAPEAANLEKEVPEPLTQRGSFPVWLIALVVLLFYGADMYVVTHGADLGGKDGAFPNTVYDPYKSFDQVAAANPVDPEKEMFESRRRVYMSAACNNCHQPNGTGSPGQIPPLAGSEWVLAENPARAIRIVLNGLTGPIAVKGETYNNMMPPLSFLESKHVAAVLTYVRNEWGNKAPPVTVEQVEKVKRELGGRTDSFTAAELEQVRLSQ